MRPSVGKRISPHVFPCCSFLFCVVGPLGPDLEARKETWCEWKESLTSTSRHGNGDVSVDEGLAALGDDRLLGGVQVVAGGEGAAAGGQLGLVRELLDEQRGGLLEGGHGGAVAAGSGGGGRHCGGFGSVVGDGLADRGGRLVALGGRRGRGRCCRGDGAHCAARGGKMIRKRKWCSEKGGVNGLCNW